MEFQGYFLNLKVSKSLWMEGYTRTALVTGGSSGIGAATAEILAGAGIRVYAASRSGKAPGREGVIPVTMDVNDPVSIKSALEHILAGDGTLDALVCCAGNGIGGDIETTSDEEVKYQFETNFFGLDKVVRACLPIFRRQGRGRIVTISSVAGFFPIPYQAYYSASKAAVTIYTKALRLEARPFGIQCCCILPGDVKTGFTSARKMTEGSQDPSSPYFSMVGESIAKMARDEQAGMKPEVIAKAVLKQLNRKRMKTVCVPRIDYKVLYLLGNIFPESFIQKVLSLLYQ